MITQPANEDYNKHAGNIALGRGLSLLPQPDRKRAEEVYACQETDLPEDSIHDWQDRSLLQLLDRIPGLAYRCHVDQERTMVFISEGCLQLTGYYPAELIHNKTISYGQLISPEDREWMWERLNRALQEGNYYDLSYRITTSGGQEKWVREIGRVLSNSELTPVWLEGLLFDITERKISERQIQRQIERIEALRKIDMAITGIFDKCSTALTGK